MGTICAASNGLLAIKKAGFQTLFLRSMRSLDMLDHTHPTTLLCSLIGMPAYGPHIVLYSYAKALSVSISPRKRGPSVSLRIVYIIHRPRKDCQV